MNLFVAIAIAVCAHLAFNGSRVVVSLYALHLQATPLVVGSMMSLYAVLPMLLSVRAGRMIDVVGVKRPIFFGCVCEAAGLLLPVLWHVVSPATVLYALFAASALIGLGFMGFQVAMQNLIGNLAGNRIVNFSHLALGMAVSGFTGPLIAGFGIDYLGYLWAFAALAFFGLLALALALWQRTQFPPAHPRTQGNAPQHVRDLLATPALRRVFIATALLSMGWDLQNFLMPIYGHRIGLSASQIGTVLAAFAAAAFLIRLAMPWLVKRLTEWQLIQSVMFTAASVYLLFPFTSQYGLLLALSFVLGLAMGAAQPNVMSLLHRHVAPARVGEALGLRSAILNASHVILPLLFGAVGSATGMMLPVYWGMALVMGAGGFYTQRSTRKHARQTQQTQQTTQNQHVGATTQSHPAAPQPGAALDAGHNASFDAASDATSNLSGQTAKPAATSPLSRFQEPV